MIDDESFGRKISGVYEEGGYKLLGIADQGFRVMSTNKKVTSIDDFKGQKIRTMENPYEVIVANRLYEQQDYIVETNHLPHLITLIMNDDFYEDMPPANQKIVIKQAEKGQNSSFAYWIENVFYEYNYTKFENCVY